MKETCWKSDLMWLEKILEMTLSIASIGFDKSREVQECLKFISMLIGSLAFAGWVLFSCKWLISCFLLFVCFRYFAWSLGSLGAQKWQSLILGKTLVWPIWGKRPKIGFIFKLSENWWQNVGSGCPKCKDIMALYRAAKTPCMGRALDLGFYAKTLGQSVSNFSDHWYL